MTAALTTTTSYARTTTLVTPRQITTLDKARSKSGYYIPAPTVAELLRRRSYLKAWYQPRDFMFELFISMARLESPFSSSKTGTNDKDTHMNKSGQSKYTIATTPFDALTLMMSIPADKHPYVTCRPTHRSHTPARMDDFDRFSQGAVDTRSNQNDFMIDMFSKLGVTGWLPTLTDFDPALQKRGEFPFDLKVLDPLNFYPQLDGQRRPLYAFLEYRVNGAQLLQSYSMFAGVMEMFDAEVTPPDGTEQGREYWQDGHNIWTTDFDVSIYYDDTYKAILVGAGDASDVACKYNSHLSRLKDSSAKKGRMASVMHSSDMLDDNPYAGIERHNLGGMPINLEGAWPEPVSPTARNSSSYGFGQYQFGEPNAMISEWGKLVYYPWLFSMRNNWMDQSKLRDMIYSAIDAWADPVIKFKTNNTKMAAQVKNQKVVTLDPDSEEDFTYAMPPPMPPEVMALMNYVDSEIQRGSFASVAYGQGNNRSARGLQANMAAGTIRENPLIRAVERSVAQFPKHVVRILMERGGDEEVFVHGNGTKWGEDGYTRTYKANDLQGVVPEVSCELLAKNGLKNSDNVLMYNSLAGTKKFPDAYLMRNVLDIVNPEKVIADAKLEMLSADVSVLKPDVEVAALEAEGKALDRRWKITEANQLKTDKYQHELAMKQVEQDMSQLSEDEKVARHTSTIQKLIAQASGQPDPNGGAPGAGPPSALPPPMPPPPTTLPHLPGMSGGAGLSSPGMSIPTGPLNNLPPNGMPGGIPPNLHVPMGSTGGLGPMSGMPMTFGGPPSGPPLGPMNPAGPSGMMPRPPVPMMRPPAPGPGPGIPPAVGRPNLSGLDSNYAKGPGQRDRIQPLAASSHIGGLGRPGVPPALFGGAGLPGQPIDSPKVEASNALMKPPTLPPLGRKRKRGRRG
jgi:hypothetical protein